MDDIPAEEDTGGADIDVAGPVIATVAATLANISTLEQTVLAIQQLGVRRINLGINLCLFFIFSR